MITEEERQSLINEAVEKSLLSLPDVVGNLIMNQINLTKLMRQFYEKYPEFTTSKDVVAAILEKIEGENPGIDYQRLLAISVPIIKEKLQTIGKLSFTPTPKPNRDFSSNKIVLDQNDLGNGEL